MDGHRKLILWILITNFLIVIAAGHGGGTIGLIQLAVVIDLIGLDDFLSKPFQHLLFWVAVFTFLGQLLLVTAIVKKLRLYLELTGLLCLLAGFLILVYYVLDAGTQFVTIVSGSPFLILTFILIGKYIRDKIISAKG